MYSHDLNQSILSHLFLPCNLPESSDSDYLLQSNHKNEHQLLESFNKFLESTNAQNTLPIFSIIKKCIENWLVLQNIETCTIANLQSTINKLTPSDFLPLYFHAQNAAILIEIDADPLNSPLISSWQVLLPTETVTSSLQPYISYYPTPTFRLSDISQLTSSSQCELLVQFMTNSIEYPQSSKASYSFDEKREVPISHYVCHWWITQFSGIENEESTETDVQFKKKYRDQIRCRYTYGSSPFRRSGLWMTMKVVLQIILTKRLGTIGNIIYKLLITNFLTYIIHTRQNSNNEQISIDLFVHCLRKIARRLNKIENMSLNGDLNDANQWIALMKKQIKEKIEQIFPKSNWQDQIHENRKPFDQLKLNLPENYRHSCTKLNDYLTKPQSVPSYQSYRYGSLYRNQSSVQLEPITTRTSIGNEQNELPLVSTLINSKKKTIEFALTRVEIWVQNNFRSWIEDALSANNADKSFENLQSFFEDYQRKALEHYYSENKSTDPMGYSRYILTSLRIIRFVHLNLCNDQRFARLKSHTIDISNLLKLFEYLVLPTQDEMSQARILYDYFREFSEKEHPELLSSIDSKDAFGVYFANQSEQMKKVLQEIQEQVEKDKTEKKEEIIREKAEHDELMKQAAELVCECKKNEYPYTKCDRCKIIQKAKGMKVNIYECPIPLRRESALAVIFELQMPIEIRCYRDILWQFINRPNPVPSNDMHEWLSTPPHQTKLIPYSTRSYSSKVKLVSSKDSITRSHYFAPRSIESTSLEDFFFENSLRVEISPTKPFAFQHECLTLTPQLTESNYKCLQFSLDNTQFAQNRVIAQLSDCSSTIKTSQFIEFGSFRSGHRLQWWNLLSILELDSLSMNEESVAILITHALLQSGPMTDNLICSWCPESHEQLLDDGFVDELILRLDCRLTECQSNWQHELVLVILTIIVMRILTICKRTKKNQMIDLALKCRQTAVKWIELISETIRNPSSLEFDNVEILRDKLRIIGLAGLLTFSLHTDFNRWSLANENVICLLKLATTVQDNLILRKKQMGTSVFMRNLIRYNERNLILLQPLLNNFLQNTSYESLSKFAAEYWAVNKSNNTTDEKWIKRDTDIYDGRYSAQYGSNRISINCARGTFLVDKLTIGFLPEKITSNDLFIRVFGKKIFEVQPSTKKDTYITKYGCHSGGHVYYEFSYNDNSRRLTIYEQYNQTETKERCQLIPFNCFEKELPEALILNYSHWRNDRKEEIEFRPIRFHDSNFLIDKHYILSTKTGTIRATNTETTQILINQSSPLFIDLFERYFIRLDDTSFVYMLRDTFLEDDQVKLGAFIHIHLSRLGIAFRFDINRNVIISREYPDMCIDENQSFGTLIGLKVGLLLSPITVNNQQNTYHLCRKLIVPYGHVQVDKTLKKNHQTVTIKRKTSSETSSSDYFVFILNDRLHILQSTDSPTGWLYLALLHAMTSHPLPDQYTGMTGMECAFQLLHSAGSWSDQPYDSISLDILSQIATLSPKVNFYPEHITCSIKIEWFNECLPYSVQHFGYYLLAKKLYETSQQWKFMYPTDTSHPIEKLFQNKEYNEKVLIKLYWDYRDLYNPTVRLSPKMEEEIRLTTIRKSYQPVWQNSSAIGGYNFYQLRNLYSSGDLYIKDSSSLDCFPLSRWLNKDYEPNKVWIGLFKFIEELKTKETPNQQHDLQRLEILFDFLRYISPKHNTEPTYFQLLKSILQSSITTLRTLPYPEFTCYENIEETSVESHRIKFPGKLYRSNREIALQEIRRCFANNREYKNESFPKWTINTYQIDRFFKSWRANRILHSFLDHIQNKIRSITIIPFANQVNVKSQTYTLESFADHYEIQIHSSTIPINQTLLTDAKQKFLHPHFNYFIQSNMSTEIISEQKKLFPEEIIPSIDSRINSLSDIAKHFKTDLKKSWTKFQEIKHYDREYPDLDQINQFFITFCQQSNNMWDELMQSITFNNELLFQTGLMIRILPTTLIFILLQNNEYDSLLHLTTDQRTLFGGILVNYIVEQQIERALYLGNHGKWEDFEKEISNIPHQNWIPAEHISWLVMELEMNITIREIQVQVARHMSNPENHSSIRNIVMQMNMGEGKTSVILPMLALSLSSSSSNLVRIIVLKALFPMNYRSLRCKLGGLLNRRILPFSCRRDMNLTNEQVQQIFHRLEQGLKDCDVVLTSPEDILSFDLLTIDKCRQQEFHTGQSMLSVQKWCKTSIRDILDESDEILHVKYQLIYSVGRKELVDGGAERWKTIQLILLFVKQHAPTIAQQYVDDVFYKRSTSQSHFPEFRLLRHQPFSKLCQLILNEYFHRISFRQNEIPIIESFVLNTNSSLADLEDRFSDTTIQFLLILRGLLSSEVLYVALKRRYRVNFGVNYNLKLNRLMAVPFRAKDVAADNTEFGHPDLAILLTQLSYYYSGLNAKQMMQCLNRMNEEEQDPDSIYEEWISQEDKVNPLISNIQQWKLINLKNHQQITEYLFPSLRQNILVINYFLNHFVFPNEAKQFPNKLIASAWDLSSTFAREQIITGFSGTNDTQLLLPTHIHQCDLPELRHTDALVLNNLLRTENEHYQSLPISPTSEEILTRIVNCELDIHVIIDVGALFIDGTNQQIAKKWLNLLDRNKTKIDYAVYFQSDEIFVIDRLHRCHAFSTSPASERLHSCVFYLDEIHTRGTDFKFPDDFRAAVTLGDGLTKDRLVQACMRMRKLGRCHWLSFWSSHEVHHQIELLKKTKEKITLVDILRWIYENVQQATWDGLHHWATQSLHFQRKLTAFQNIYRHTEQQTYTNTMMEQLANDCLEKEVLKLESMYGSAKIWQTILQIYSARYHHFQIRSFAEIHQAVTKRLQDYGGSNTLLSQLLDEEQQRELQQEQEQELEEERQLKRPPIVQPYQPILYEEIKRLCNTQGPTMKLSKLTSVFRPLKDAFLHTTFHQYIQSHSWQTNLWITTEFQRVIQTSGESLDSFMRPPRWVLIYRNKHLILVSAFEANWLMGKLKLVQSSTTTLRLLLPRLQRDQSICIDTPRLTIPPTVSSSIPNEWLAQLFVFNSTLYFNNVEEQTAYCQCLGLCPKPRTKSEDDAFDNGWIALDGYVQQSEHRQQLQLHHCCFSSNPLIFVKKLIENRNSSHAPLTSHVGSIIFKAVKLEI